MSRHPCVLGLLFKILTSRLCMSMMYIRTIARTPVACFASLDMLTGHPPHPSLPDPLPHDSLSKLGLP